MESKSLNENIKIGSQIYNNIDMRDVKKYFFMQEFNFLQI